jgi:threonine synthase
MQAKFSEEESPMDFIGTRGGEAVSSLEAARFCLCRAGGVYAPIEMPRRFKDGDMATLAWLPHGRRVAHIFSMFCKEIEFQELVEHAEAVYTKERYGVHSTPIRKEGGVCTLELWNGPTGSPEDLSLGILPALLRAADGAGGEAPVDRVALCTDVETALAAAEAFREDKNTRIAALYAADSATARESRLAALAGDRLLLLPLSGDRRVAEDIATAFLREGDDRRLLPLNASHWMIFLARVIVYVSAYCEMVLRRHVKFGKPIHLAISGDRMDDVAAALMAKRMGTPIGRVIVAARQDSFLCDLTKSGRIVKASLSGGELPGGLERLLFALSGRNPGFLKTVCDGLSEDGVYTLPPDMVEELREDLWVATISDEETRAEMAASHQEEAALLTIETAAIRVAAKKYATENGADIPVLHVAPDCPFAGDVASTPARLPPEEAVRKLRLFQGHNE